MKNIYREDILGYVGEFWKAGRIQILLGDHFVEFGKTWSGDKVTIIYYRLNQNRLFKNTFWQQPGNGFHPLMLFLNENKFMDAFVQRSQIDFHP